MKTKPTEKPTEKPEFVVNTLKEICTFKRSGSVTVHVRVVTFGDNPTPKLDLRQYVEGKNWQGWGKGLALSAAEWDELQTTTARTQIADALRPAAPAKLRKTG